MSTFMVIFLLALSYLLLVYCIWYVLFKGYNYNTTIGYLCIGYVLIWCVSFSIVIIK